MNVSIQRFCAWSGVIFILIFLVAVVFVAPFVPPVSPALSSAQVAALFKAHSVTIRIASVLAMYACAFGWVWTASVAIWTAQMEGKMPVLSIAQIPCGAFSFGGSYFACIAWVSATFRPDRPDDIVYLMNDQAWFWIVLMGSCAVMQLGLIGLAVLNDKSPDPVFPRWVGYFNLWMGVLQIPGLTAAFFKTGPFAWDGLFAFWTPLTTFSLWILVDTWAVLRAIKRNIVATHTIPL